MRMKQARRFPFAFFVPSQFFLPVMMAAACQGRSAPLPAGAAAVSVRCTIARFPLP